MGAAVKCFRFPKGTTCADTALPSCPPTSGSVMSERRPRSRLHTHSSGSKAWIWKDKQPLRRRRLSGWAPWFPLPSPQISLHCPIPTAIPHDPFSLQSGPPSARSPQPTYLFALFLGDPCPVAHRTKELKLQFVYLKTSSKDGGLGKHVLPPHTTT